MTLPFDYPDRHRLERCRLLAVQIRDRVASGPPDPSTVLVPVKLHPETTATLDQIIDLIDDALRRLDP